MMRVVRHVFLGALLALVLHVLVPKFNSLLDFPVASDSKTHSLHLSLPPFVKHKLVPKARSVTSLGYESLTSLPDVFNWAPVNIAVQFASRVEEINMSKGTACRSQQQLAMDLLEYVEAQWKTSLFPPPYRGAGFVYGSFDRQAWSRGTNITEVSSLGTKTSHFRKDFRELAMSVLDLLDDVALIMRDREPVVSEQAFLEEFAIVATMTSLVLNGFDILLDVLESHLLRLGKLLQYESGDSKDDEQVLRLLETIYENGIWLFVGTDVTKDFCQG